MLKPLSSIANALTSLYERETFSDTEAKYFGAGFLLELEKMLKRRYVVRDEHGTWTITELGKSTYIEFRRLHPFGE